MNVLVAEDDPVTRTVLAAIFSRLPNVNAEFVFDGVELVKAFTKDPNKYDLIISDVMMPDKNGLEAIAEIKKVRNVPCVIVSDVNDKAIPWSTADFSLNKPLTANKINHIVQMFTGSGSINNTKGNGMNILVAEDDFVSRVVIESLLKKIPDVEATIVVDGQELVEAFEADPNKYDLVIADVMMPRKNGLDAIAEIKKIRRVPCITVSAVDKRVTLFNDIGKEISWTHSDFFLKKPLAPHELNDAVEMFRNRIKTK